MAAARHLPCTHKRKAICPTSHQEFTQILEGAWCPKDNNLSNAMAVLKRTHLHQHHSVPVCSSCFKEKRPLSFAKPSVRRPISYKGRLSSHLCFRRKGRVAPLSNTAIWAGSSSGKHNGWRLQCTTTNTTPGKSYRAAALSARVAATWTGVRFQIIRFLPKKIHIFGTRAGLLQTGPFLRFCCTPLRKCSASLAR